MVCFINLRLYSSSYRECGITFRNFILVIVYLELYDSPAVLIFGKIVYPENLFY